MHTDTMRYIYMMFHISTETNQMQNFKFDTYNTNTNIDVYTTNKNKI